MRLARGWSAKLLPAPYVCEEDQFYRADYLDLPPGRDVKDKSAPIAHSLRRGRLQFACFTGCKAACIAFVPAPRTSQGCYVCGITARHGRTLSSLGAGILITPTSMQQRTS